MALKFGYLAGGGTVELNIAIRTMTLRNGISQLSVGGGIIADSVPAEEFEETLVKAAVLQRSIGVSSEIF